MVPELSGRDTAKMSPDEQDLARYVYVLLPNSHAATEFLPSIRRWQCVDHAYLQPATSLPDA